MPTPTPNNVVDAHVAATTYDRSEADLSQQFQATRLIPRCDKASAVPLVVHPHAGSHGVSFNSFPAGVLAIP